MAWGPLGTSKVQVYIDDLGVVEGKIHCVEGNMLGMEVALVNGKSVAGREPNKLWFSTTSSKFSHIWVLDE